MSNRYVKANYGCHCFYNDSSLKRYERAHFGGDTLIFNFGNCGGYTPHTCSSGGFWGGFGAGLGMGLLNIGMNFLGSWLGGMGNMFGGWMGGMGNMFGGWMGGVGATSSGNWNWGNWGNWGNNAGNSSVKGSGSSGKSGSSSSSKETSSTTGTASSDSSVGANPTGSAGESVVDNASAGDGSASSSTGVDSSATGYNSEIQGDTTKLHDAGIDPATANAYLNIGISEVDDMIELRKAGIGPAEAGGYIEDGKDDIGKMIAEHNADDDESAGEVVDDNQNDDAQAPAAVAQDSDADATVKINGADVKISELTPVAILELINSDIDAIKQAGKIDALIKQLGVDEITDNGRKILTLPTSMDVTSIKALAKLSKAAGIPVAMGYNSSDKVNDHYIAGYIDPESVKVNDENKLTYDIDCEGVKGAIFGNKYTVTQIEGARYNIKVSVLRSGEINEKYKETGVEYELNSDNKRLERNGDPYIIHKK